MSAPIETETIRNLKISQGVISDAQSNIMRNLAKIGTVDGPASLNMDVITSFDELVTVTDKIAKIGEIVRTIYNPAFYNKFLSLEQEIETLTEEENKRRILEEQRRIQHERIDSFRVRVEIGDLSVAQFERAQEIAQRLLEAQGIFPIKEPEVPAPPKEVATVPEFIADTGEWYDIAFGPVEKKDIGDENEKAYRVTFANGRVFGTDDEKEFKLVQRVNADLKDSKGVEISRGDLVVAVYGRFDREIAEETEDIVRELSPRLEEMVGVKVSYVRKSPEDEHDTKLRRVFIAEVITPKDEKKAKKIEHEGLSETEKVQKVLEMLLEEDDAQMSVVIELMRERVEGRFPNDGERAFTPANTIAELIRVIKEDLYEKIVSGADDIFKPQVDLWNKVKEKSGQPDDFTARRFFEARIREWYRGQAQKPTVGSSAGSEQGGNAGREDKKDTNTKKKVQNRGAIRQKEEIPVADGITVNLMGGENIKYFKGAVVKTWENPLTMNQLVTLMGESRTDVVAHLGLFRGYLSALLADSGLEFYMNGSSRDPNTTFELRPIQTAVSTDADDGAGKDDELDGAKTNGGASRQPNQKEADARRDLEDDAREIIRQHDLLHKVEMKKGQVQSQIPAVRGNVDKIFEKRYIQGQIGTTRGDVILTPKQVVQLVLIDRAMKAPGGINRTVEGAIRNAVDSAWEKELKASQRRST